MKTAISNQLSAISKELSAISCQLSATSAGIVFSSRDRQGADTP